MNVYEFLEKRAREYPHKPAIIFKDQPISFTQLRDMSFQLANGLVSLGVKKGDRIAIYLPNWPEYIYSYLAIFLLRGVCVPLDFMLTQEELIGFINHSESKILIAQAKKGVDLNKIKEKCSVLEKIIMLQEDRLSVSSKAEDKLSFQNPKVDESDYAAIFYTSGSTGHPKGVLLTSGCLNNPIETVDYFLHPTDKDSFLCAIAFSHIAGLDYLLFMLYFATTLVLMEHFHPLEFLKELEKYKVTIFCIVPSMYVAILSLKEYDKFDLSSLRYAVVFGAPSSPVLLERFHKVCPHAYLLNGWGMTETSAPNSFLPTGTQTKEIEHTGEFPVTTEVKIVDEQANTLGDEKEGELWIRAKAVMVGYYKEPQLTQQVLTEDGWLKTGDIAKRDKQGRYYIVGRIKDMIKVAGEIVFSPEVEEVIQHHPKVKETAVIGMPDKLRGEVPKAFVVLKEKEILSEEELRYFLREHLAHFKIPHYFEFMAELPKNRVGKIDKEVLKNVLPDVQQLY